MQAAAPRLPSLPPYDAKSAWKLRYESAIAEDEFGDATTLARGVNPFVVRYHYNAVENAILEHALRRGFPSRPTVLYVGSGAGHWIDFYRDAFAATEVVGVEISPTSGGSSPARPALAESRKRPSRWSPSASGRRAAGAPAPPRRASRCCTLRGSGRAGWCARRLTASSSSRRQARSPKGQRAKPKDEATSPACETGVLWTFSRGK